MSGIPVAVSISSVQEDGGLRGSTRREHRGVLHERDGGAYLIYDDDEGCAVTLRLSPGQVRMYRRGAMNAWQDFRTGEWTGGLFALGEGRHGEMVLRVLTRSLALTLAAAGGHLALVYDLFTADSAEPDADPTALPLGRFTLDVAWTPLPPLRSEGTP